MRNYHYKHTSLKASILSGEIYILTWQLKNHIKAAARPRTNFLKKSNVLFKCRGRKFCGVTRAE